MYMCIVISREGTILILYEIWSPVRRKRNSFAVMCKQCNNYYRHESHPYIPDIDGYRSYTGEIMHSTYHQNPKLYTGKTVIVLGAMLSGTDVAMDIRKTAKHVSLQLPDRL